MKPKYVLFSGLIILSPAIALLLASPSLTGKAGIFLFGHTYIRDFPNALCSVVFTLASVVALCEVLHFVLPYKKRLLSYAGLMASAAGLFAYVHTLFNRPGYRLAGKGFIAGAHALPVILAFIIGYYLYKEVKNKKNTQKMD